MVEESETMEGENVIQYAQMLRSQFAPSVRISYLHGKMKAADKQKVMDDLSEGKIDVLVSTTVVEVGVNVPDATVMFVYGADRFGLSQLHQLRGRVGRGKEQAYCVLYTDNQNETTQLRMKLMCEIRDGALLAEKDLLLRGAGEFFGYHQHGMPDLKAADIVRDLPLLELAKHDAKEAVDKGLDFKEELRHRFGGQFFERIYY